MYFFVLCTSEFPYLFAEPGPVTGAWFQVTGSTTIRVYWRDTPEPNGVVTKYSFRYWAKDPTWDHHRGVQFQENENAKQYVLTGLNPYTTYAINVRAVNGAGEGENTRLVAQTWQAGKTIVSILFFVVRHSPVLYTVNDTHKHM